MVCREIKINLPYYKYKAIAVLEVADGCQPDDSYCYIEVLAKDSTAAGSFVMYVAAKAFKVVIVIYEGDEIHVYWDENDFRELSEMMIDQFGYEDHHF